MPLLFARHVSKIEASAAAAGVAAAGIAAAVVAAAEDQQKDMIHHQLLPKAQNPD